MRMAEIKAKLEVTKTPNGAKQVTFHYEKNGKPKKLILSQTTEKEKVDFSLNGKDCIYENDGSKIVKLTVDGQEIFNIKGQGAIVKKPMNVPGKDFPGGGKKRWSPVGSANAPYNFIPLNTKIVPSEHGKWEKIPGFEKYQAGTLSGTIELKIKTQTPMYIRDAKTPSMEETAQPPSFFAPDGTPKIPGSSLKGLIRSMVEITSYSKFSFE